MTPQAHQPSEETWALGMGTERLWSVCQKSSETVGEIEVPWAGEHPDGALAPLWLPDSVKVHEVSP